MQTTERKKNWQLVIATNEQLGSLSELSFGTEIPLPTLSKIVNQYRNAIESQKEKICECLGKSPLELGFCSAIIPFSNNHCLRASISSMLEMANSWTVTICFGSLGFAMTTPLNLNPLFSNRNSFYRVDLVKI